MKLSPRFVGPVIGLVTGLMTSTSMSFVGLATNYGFHPDFFARWAKAAAIGYVTAVPLLMILVPIVQRFVLKQVGIPQQPQGAR